MAEPQAPADDPPPIEPIEPDFEACCGNGCEPCIFDIYALERERYLSALETPVGEGDTVPEHCAKRVEPSQLPHNEPERAYSSKCQTVQPSGSTTVAA